MIELTESNSATKEQNEIIFNGIYPNLSQIDELDFVDNDCLFFYNIITRSIQSRVSGSVGSYGG